MNNFTKTEKTIFICALLVLVVFSYFLYDDSLLFSNSNTANLNQIGQFSVSANDVRRKNLENFAWTPASKSDNVFENDSIFTGDDSEALITLSDGSTLKVEANSLITLKLNNGQMNLDLRYGNLVGELNEGATLQVTSGQEEFKLEGSKGNEQEKSTIRLKRATKGVVDLTLLKGAAKVIDKKQAAQALEPQKNLAVRGDTIAKVERHKIVLLTENNLNILRSTPTAPLNFKWEAQGTISGYQIEFSEEPSFENSPKTFRTEQKSFTLSEELPLSKHYWRVSTLDASGVNTVSETRHFTLSSLPIPIITEPVHQSILNLEIKKSEETLSYSLPIAWTAPDSLKNFKYQISDSEDFSNILQENTSTIPQAKTQALTSGSYYLRVQGFSPDNQASGWSNVHTFQLNLSEKPLVAPAKPILTTPLVTLNVENENTPPPTLGWRRVLNAVNYLVEISANETFSEKLEYTTRSNSISWSAYKPGKYKFRVQALGEENLKSPYSDLGNIEISTAPLFLNPLTPINAISANPEPQKVPLKWSTLPFASSYQVQITQNSEFSEDGSTTPNTQSLVTLQNPGLYKVRIRAFDTNNTVIGTSNTQEVSYSHRPPLPPPQLLEPFNNASVFLQKDTEPFIWLEWKKLQHAGLYNIEVSSDPEFKKIILQSEQKGNRFLIKSRLPLGTIYWRVRAKSANGAEISAWSQARQFVLHHQKNEGIVK